VLCDKPVVLCEIRFSTGGNILVGRHALVWYIQMCRMILVRTSHGIGLWQVSITLLLLYPEDGGSTFVHNVGTY